MTPTAFHLLPPRELTPQPNSQGLGLRYNDNDYTYDDEGEDEEDDEHGGGGRAWDIPSPFSTLNFNEVVSLSLSPEIISEHQIF